LDQETGRFVSRDPFAGITGLPKSLNRFVYVLNNPLVYVDPSGRVCESVVGWLGLGNECRDVAQAVNEGVEKGVQVIENGVQNLKNNAEDIAVLGRDLVILVSVDLAAGVLIGAQLAACPETAGATCVTAAATFAAAAAITTAFVLDYTCAVADLVNDSCDASLSELNRP